MSKIVFRPAPPLNVLPCCNAASVFATIFEKYYNEWRYCLAFFVIMKKKNRIFFLVEIKINRFCDIE